MDLNKGYHLEYCLVVDVEYHPFVCSTSKSKLFMKKCLFFKWISLCFASVNVLKDLFSNAKWNEYFCSKIKFFNIGTALVMYLFFGEMDNRVVAAISWLGLPFCHT